MLTCEQRDPAGHRCLRGNTRANDLHSESFQREMHREKGGKKEWKKEENDREEEGKNSRERGSARYQVPVPSRHHGGITVSGCPIGFNRKQLSRTAEFCREMIASLTSRPSIYSYLSIRPWASIDPTMPAPLVLFLHNSVSGPCPFNKEDSRIILHRRLSHFANSNLKFYTREIINRQTVTERDSGFP